MNIDGPFHGKCAYCESCIAVIQPGDVEHFRPHGEVSDINWNIIKIIERGEYIKHPGYYWLAYDWRNLLPSCRDCNSMSKWKTDNTLIGKHTRFPVRGYHAIHPNEEVHEDPLLINPAFEEPSLHLELDETGIFSALTDRGQACIDIFGLNRPALVICRRDAYQQGIDYYIPYLDAILNEDTAKERRYSRIIVSFLERTRPFSAAGRAGIESGRKRKRPDIMRMLQV